MTTIVYQKNGEYLAVLAEEELSIFDVATEKVIFERFECVDRMHSVVAFEKDTFYIYDDKKYYKVPYASYSEILRKGYEYLGDYKPDDGTLEKYNMMK